MHETHRFGAFASLAIVGAALFLSAAVEAGRVEEVLPPAPLMPLAPVVAVQPSVRTPHLSTAVERTEVMPETVATTLRGAPVGTEPVAAVPAAEPALDIPRAAMSEPVVDATPEVMAPPKPVAPSPTAANTVSLRTPESTVVVRQPVTETSSTEDVFLHELETLIHELTNQARKEEGLAALAYDSVLASNARAYSENMQAENFISHVDQTGCNMTCRFKADGYAAYYWGENLARWRSSYAPTVTEVARYFVDEWKASDGHRDNLFSVDFTHEGIGASIADNEIYVTVHFAEPK